MQTKARLRAIEKRLRLQKEGGPVQLSFRFGKPGEPREPGVLWFDYGDNGMNPKDGKGEK